MENEAKNTEKAKIRTFNVMDQTVAHRLALEGFEILKVVPSNKYAKEAHFIFSFNASSAFKKHFKEILHDVESETGSPKTSEEETFQKEKAEMAASIQKLTSEVAALKEEICEKDAQIMQLNAEKSAFCSEKCEEKRGNSEQIQEMSEACELQCLEADNSEVLNKLAELQAISNCILSTVSAIGFQMNVYKTPVKEG